MSLHVENWRNAKSQNGRRKKTKHAKFSEKRTFLTSYAYQGLRNVFFFGIFGELCCCINDTHMAELVLY